MNSYRSGLSVPGGDKRPHNTADYVNNSAKQESRACREAHQVYVPEKGVDLDVLLEDIEKQHILRALEKSGGNMTKAAGLLNVSYRSIRYKVKKYNLKAGR